MKTKVLFENWRHHLKEAKSDREILDAAAKALDVSTKELISMGPLEAEFVADFLEKKGLDDAIKILRRRSEVWASVDAAEDEASRERLALRQRRADAQKAGRSEPQDGVRDPLNPLGTAPMGSGEDQSLADYKAGRVQRAIDKKKAKELAAKKRKAFLRGARSKAFLDLKKSKGPATSAQPASRPRVRPLEEESYRMVKDPISGKRRMMRSDELGDAMAQVDDELPLTAAFPWMQSVIDDLKDDEFPDKEKAIQALAKQLGMSIKTMPSDMDEEPTMSEVKTISKKKFETTLENLVFEELARVFMEQENQPSEKELKEIAARIMNSVNKILKSKKIYTRTGPSVGNFEYDYALGIMGVKLGKTVLELSKVAGYKLASLESFVAKMLANIPSNQLKKSSAVGGSTPFMFVPYNVWKQQQIAAHKSLMNQLSKKRAEKKKKSKGKDSQGVTRKDVLNYLDSVFPNLSKDQKSRLLAFDGSIRRVDGKSIFTPSDKMKKMFPNAKPVQVSGPRINDADTLAILKAAGKPTMPTTRRTAGAD
tara:strand:- start:13815 stop:15428 length:1614 start_codon:yes stop_codon:yes gene_type:complete